MTSNDATQNAVTENNIGAPFDRFKAIGNSQLTAAAKYIATLMVATGAHSPTQLRTLSGLGKTTVYRVLKEIFESPVADIFEAIPACPTIPESPAIPADGTFESSTSPAYGKIREKTVPQVPPMGLSGPEPSCAQDITTRPTKELPSEVSYLNNITPLLRRPPSPKKSTGIRGTRLANDWELPEDWLQWARMNFAHADDAMVRAEAESFRDFWISKTGASATKLDWLATWRNWCRNSRTLARTANPRPFNTGRMAYDEQKAAEMASLRDYVARRGRGEEASLQ